MRDNALRAIADAYGIPVRSTEIEGQHFIALDWRGRGPAGASHPVLANPAVDNPDSAALLRHLGRPTSGVDPRIPPAGRFNWRSLLGGGSLAFAAWDIGSGLWRAGTDTRARDGAFNRDTPEVREAQLNALRAEHIGKPVSTALGLSRHPLAITASILGHLEVHNAGQIPTRLMQAAGERGYMQIRERLATLSPSEIAALPAHVLEIVRHGQSLSHMDETLRYFEGEAQRPSGPINHGVVPQLRTDIVAARQRRDLLVYAFMRDHPEVFERLGGSNLGRGTRVAVDGQSVNPVIEYTGYANQHLAQPLPRSGARLAHLDAGTTPTSSPTSTAAARPPAPQ